MTGPLSNPADNLAEEINKDKYIRCLENCLEFMEETCKTNYKGCKCYLEYVEIRDKKLQFQSLKCIKNHEKRS